MLALMVAVLWLRWRWRCHRASRRVRRALRREREAEGVLVRAGYDIVDRQATTTWTVWRDGEPIHLKLRADYLVGRAGRRFVAEVKTGDDAPRLTTAATRRQLLEYAVAYEVDGVVLVDMGEETVSDVVFKGLTV